MKDRGTKQSKNKSSLRSKYPNYGSIYILKDGYKCFNNIIENKDGEMNEDEKHNLWRENVPYLYDTIVNHCEMGESSYFCMGFGKEIKESRSSSKIQSDNIYFTSKSSNSTFNTRTGTWNGSGEQIYMASAEIKPANTTLLTFVGKYPDHTKNNSVNIIKKLIHPDNLIKMQCHTYSSNMLFTLSASSFIHLWDMDNQQSKGYKVNNEPNIPTLTLQGNIEENENVNLSTLLVNRYIQRILSSSDNNVLVWDVEDCEKSQSSKLFYENETLYNVLPNRLILKTKNDKPIKTVEYQPLDQSASIILGGSNDGSLYIWDIRCSNDAINTIPNIHHSELTSVGWEQVEGNIIAVGFNDGIIKLLDYRFLTTNSNSKSSENSSSSSSSSSRSPSDNHHQHYSKQRKSNEKMEEEEEEEEKKEKEREKVEEENEGESSTQLNKASSSESSTGSIFVGQLRSGYSPINELKWSPHKSGYLGVCSDDIVIWNTSSMNDKTDILFRHCGNRGKMLSFDWHSVSNWTIGSASNEIVRKDKEDVMMCNIQLWRISELITNEFDRATVMDWSKV